MKIKNPKNRKSRMNRNNKELLMVTEFPKPPFTPQREPDAQTNRKATTLTAIIGQNRKAKFVKYCKQHGIGQTEMIKQMIDYCMKEKNQNKSCDYAGNGMHSQGFPM